MLGVCQVTCNAGDANQQWAVNTTDRTVRLAQDAGWCLDVAPAADASIVYLAPCTPGAASQQWVFTASSGQFAGLFGRLAEGGDRSRQGYGFTLSQSGTFALLNSSQILASGQVDVPVVGSWHTLALAFAGSVITASINGTAVASVHDTTYSAGLVSLVSYWGVAYFDNFSVGP